VAERKAGPRLVGELAAAVGVAAAAAGLALLAAGRTWLRLTVSTEGMPAQEVAVTGTDALPWLRAAALVALACLGAVLVTRDRWRQVVGGLLVVSGAVLGVGAAMAGPAVTEARRAGVEATLAVGDPAVADVLARDAQPGGWRWLLLASGLVLVAVGAAVVVRCRRWPAMGRRYEHPREHAATDRADPADPADPLETWQALDQGRDPTR